MHYKVLAFDQSSHHGGSGKWVKKRWRSVEGELVPCANGIHYCQHEHLIRWIGPTIWIFEDGTPDETINNGDKMVTRKGRVVERLDTWNETTARLFAADCAELALSVIPSDHQAPFVAAINAARGFARGEISDAERSAARSAAESAAWSAARSAAESAAWSAAWSAARSAAESAARSAAESAAWSAQTEILFDYLEGRRS
jgi:hypothetical protein